MKSSRELNGLRDSELIQPLGTPGLVERELPESKRKGVADRHVYASDSLN